MIETRPPKKDGVILIISFSVFLAVIGFLFYGEKVYGWEIGRKPLLLVTGAFIGIFMVRFINWFINWLMKN